MRYSHRNKVLSGYGSTSPAEFFAVASEVFFENGKRMKDRLPKLYAQLEQYYGVDPAGWKKCWATTILHVATQCSLML